MPSQDQFVFVHIPKTAGTTLTNLLAKKFFIAPAFRGNIAEYQKHISEYQAFAGHFRFCDLFGLLPEARFVTILREPVARCYSAYRSMHDRANADENWRAVASAEELSAIDFFQTHSFEETVLSDNPWVTAPYLNYQVSLLADEGAEGRDAVESAYRNLVERFFFFGIFELFGLSVQMLMAKLGQTAEVAQLPKLNASTVKMPTLSPRALQRLRELVELDIRLYEAALPIFGESAALYGQSLVAQPRKVRPMETDAQPSTKPSEERQGAGPFISKALWHTLDLVYEGRAARQVSCLICGFSAPASRFGKLVDQCQFGGGRLERHQCPDCDCIFGPAKYLDLAEDLVQDDYRALYETYSEADSSQAEFRTFKSLRPRPELLYLNWGCGGEWSQSVSRLRAEGWDVWGYEPHAKNSNPFIVSLRGQISARFHGIFSHNLIEHLRDPIAQFRDFHNILAPGGRMAHSTACYEYRYANTRFHTVFLLGRSAERLASQTGFRIVERVQEGEYGSVLFERV